MDKVVSRRLQACIVGHSFVRRLGELLEREARWDGTEACVGIAAPGLLRVDDVYKEVWMLSTLHGIRSDIFTTRNLFSDVVILNCGSNNLCDRFVDVERISHGHVSYAHLLTIVWSETCLHIGSCTAKQVPPSERCRVLVLCAVAQLCSVCPHPAIWQDPFWQHEEILALPWWFLGAACVCMVPRWNPP